VIASYVEARQLGSRIAELPPAIPTLGYDRIDRVKSGRIVAEPQQSHTEIEPR
jgi:hypothetical protein